ncbi:hypothetical protein [Leucobacter chromiireducens]
MPALPASCTRPCLPLPARRAHFRERPRGRLAAFTEATPGLGKLLM